ncbi:MAG: TetR/AcrR family transcriptional regulator [Actinomycetota bacterium]
MPMSDPHRRRLPREERREEVLEAALRLFAHRDVESVAMHELAKECGASPALVYHYFGDKHRLASAALGRAADELISRMSTDPEDPVSVQLLVGLDVYLEYLRDHPVSWKALLTAGGARDPELADIARRVDDHVVGLCLRALEVSSPPLALDLALRGWLELVKSVCLRWLRTGQPDQATVQTLLAGAFFGCVEAAVAADPVCTPILDRLESE